MIRTAKIGDVKRIHQLLTGFASEGLMLPKSLSELYENIRDFYVYEEDGAVVGTGCLQICWEDLAEVCSLAVDPSVKGRGIGRLLVAKTLEDARSLGINRVFALTYQVDFFRKLGFGELDKAELPHKIWRDCIKCAKFPDCDETAMVIDLS